MVKYLFFLFLVIPICAQSAPLWEFGSEARTNENFFSSSRKVFFNIDFNQLKNVKQLNIPLTEDIEIFSLREKLHYEHGYHHWIGKI